MSTRLELECQCGRMRGDVIDVVPRDSSHITCYCDDCQAFARFLGGERVVDGQFLGVDFVDAHGGTEIFHTTPSQVRITAGHEQLRCMRLSDKGMLRWYAGCCRTPIANSLPPRRLPFVSLIHTFIVEPAPGPLRDAALGPITARIYARFARNGWPAGGQAGASISLLLRSLRLLAIGFLRRKYTPSAFLDDITGKPRVAVQVLTAAERAALRPSAV